MKPSRHSKSSDEASLDVAAEEALMLAVAARAKMIFCCRPGVAQRILEHHPHCTVIDMTRGEDGDPAHSHAALHARIDAECDAGRLSAGDPIFVVMQDAVYQRFVS